ncbi:MAG: hypothetical protein JXA30_07520 [Deltaproteobacteria bacterium]|nr:hypothetical protein [Deltaproteobacteria bacterium]
MLDSLPQAHIRYRYSVSVQGGKKVGGQFARKTERARRAGEDGTCCT